MNKRITHITISTHERDQTLGEIAFFDPLGGGGRTHPSPSKKTSPFFITHTLIQKVQNLLKQIFFKNANSFFFSKGSSIEERKCKTILALFLSQKSLANYYLKDEEKRFRFAEAVQEAAQEMGYSYHHLSLQSEDLLLEQLTTFEGESRSLLEDKKGFERSLLALSHQERERLLFILLRYLERIPITSVVEVAHDDREISFAMTTMHGRTEIREDEPGRIFCYKEENRSYPSHRFCQERLSDQHLIKDPEEDVLLCALCGNLERKKKVLAQILFLIDYDPDYSIDLHKEGEGEPLRICFTSFYSWHELDLITAEKHAIDSLDGQRLGVTNHRGERHHFTLQLFHYNIPLSNWYEPKETKATLNDLNDETLLSLTLEWMQKKGKGVDLFVEIEEILQRRKELAYEDETELFFKRRKLMLEAIDLFRAKKRVLIDLLDQDVALRQLLHSSLAKGFEMDEVLYLHYVLEGLNILHNHNSNHLTKLLSVEAALKAARGYEKVEGRSFIPCEASEDGIRFFQFLYSIYMVLDEPRLHAALSGGFLHENRYYEAICKNKQLSHYLSPHASHLLRV